MAGFAATLNSLKRMLSPPAQPKRLLVARRLHLFAALGAGIAATLTLLIGYYATLALLPTATAYPTTLYPFADWATRMDLAQFVGSLMYPPVPTALTWWLGFIALVGTLVTLGVVYAFLLSWTLQTSSLFHGIGFGGALFVGLALTLTLANGLHPAIIRNALPDTGLFLLGWSALATIQLLVVHLLYGAVLGAVYQRLSAERT